MSNSLRAFVSGMAPTTIGSGTHGGSGATPDSRMQFAEVSPY